MITIVPEKLPYLPNPESPVGKMLQQVLDLQRQAYAQGQVVGHLRDKIKEEQMMVKRQYMWVRNPDPVEIAAHCAPINEWKVQFQHECAVEQQLLDQLIALRERWWTQYKAYVKARAAVEREAALQSGS